MTCWQLRGGRLSSNHCHKEQNCSELVGEGMAELIYWHMQDNLSTGDRNDLLRVWNGVRSGNEKGLSV